MLTAELLPSLLSASGRGVSAALNQATWLLTGARWGEGCGVNCALCCARRRAGTDRLETYVRGSLCPLGEVLLFWLVNLCPLPAASRCEACSIRKFGQP